MEKTEEGERRIFGGKEYEFYMNGNKKEIEREAKYMRNFGSRLRRTKAKRGWDLWIRDSHRFIVGKRYKN